jgi:hypothetical protein
VGQVESAPSASSIVERLLFEYSNARQCADVGLTSNGNY